MAGRNRRPDKNYFTYKLILGVLIVTLALGAAGTCYFAIHYNENRFLFWAFLIWTVFYAVTIYCWVDEDRYDKYERMMKPVAFGAVFLLLVALLIGGLVINVPKIASGEDLITTVSATAIAGLSLGVAAYFIYRFFLKEYIDELFRRETKN